MKEAGLFWRTARPEHSEVDPEEVAEFKVIKKRRELIQDDYTIVTVDQHNKPIETVQRRGWFETGSRPSVKVSGSRKSVTFLGGVTNEGDSFYYLTEETLTGEHAVAYLRSPQAEFGEKIVVLLDRAPYFYAKKVWILSVMKKQPNLLTTRASKR